jgi:hypothetical protein
LTTAEFDHVTSSEEQQMNETNETSCQISFTSHSSLATGFHIRAALGGGPPHVFLLDTGSVGILVPRHTLGPDYQNFDPSQDITFGFVSSGNMYHGQWVEVPVSLGVPASWDGMGDYPTTQVEVFAVDQPVDFDGGVFGIGFAIGGSADGGAARNPLLQTTFKGLPLSPGYIVSTKGIEIGLTPVNTNGFGFIALDRDTSDDDWKQSLGSITLTAEFHPDDFSVDLPILMDTGIAEMILWISANQVPFNLPKHRAFPARITASISMPPEDQMVEPTLQYSFVTGDTSQSMAPSHVEWRVGHGINTGRNVLAGADYLYDAEAGRVGFRVLAA